MENASKALIIAGAILLAIVIISLGLVVVNNVRSTIDKTNLNAQEIEAQNSKFTPYQGDRVAGAKVQQLQALVNASNGSRNMEITNGASEADVVAEITWNAPDRIVTGKYYSVDLTFDANGFVNSVTVAEV